METKGSKVDVAFYDGVLCVLSIIASSDYETLYEEIVRAVGEGELVKAARQRHILRWSGLTKYGYGKKKK